MKHIATMKYIDVMKRVVTIKYQKWLVSALTLLLTWFGVPEMYSSRYFRAGDKIYIDVRQDKWDGGFDWSNDGANILMHLWGSGVNEWVHMNYKEYEHNDHKIRIYSGIIPTTGTYTGCNILRKASGHTEHDYTNIWNRTGDISVNDVYIYHYGNGESQTWGEWAHTLPDGRILAPYRSDLKNYAGLKADLASGGIAAEEYTICPSAAGDIISLHCKVNAGRTDYDETNVWQHAWYYSVDEGATWETLDGYAGCIRNDYEGNRTLFPTLPDPLPATICYYLHSHVASGCRLIKFTTDATGCDYDCTITSVERAISNVRAEDNTFTLDGLVAFGVADGDLKIVYAEGTPEEVVKTITTPVSPQSFSIEGLPAATTSGVVRTLKAYFTGNPSCVKSFADVPVPDVRDAQITHETIHLLTGTSQTLTPTDYEVTNHAEWIDATEVAHNSAAGAEKTFGTMPSDTAGTHYYIYKEYYPMDCSNEDMMSNGDYEAATGYGTMGSVSDVSDYIFWGKYDNISTEIDFYDNEAINPKTGSPSRPTYESNGFAVIQHSKNFYGKYATIEAKHGTHFGLYDASSDGVAGKKAWYANTTTNPDLKLKKGMTYVFSFWAANINNYGEMDNAAVLQFQIEYNGNTELLGAPLDLGSAEFHNNIWHQCSSTFYASEDASEVTISVVNLNTDLLRVGNDFALDDIQFHAISTVAEVAKSYQQFRVDFHIPTLSAFTATPVQMGCGESSYSVDLHIEYKNQPGTLKVIDITDGGSSVVWDTALVALPGAGAGATWEEVKTIDRRVVQTIGSSDPVGKTRTYKVYFEDWTSANLTDDFNDPVIPVLTATHNNNPTAILPCDQLIYTLTVDVSYQNMSSDKIRVWVDGASYDASLLKQEKTITTGTSSIQSIKFAIDNVPADSAEHMLHVECAGLGEGCFAPVTFRAPFSPKVVEPITVTTPTLNCGSAETYTASVSVTTINHRNATLTAKLGSSTLSKVVTGDVTTFDFSGLPADGSTGNEVIVYFDYVHATLSTCEKSATFTAPMLPKAALVTPITMPTVAACDQQTFNLSVFVKFTNQDGDLQVKVDDGSWNTYYTPSESAGDGKYIKNSAEQTKLITLTGLPADGGITHKIYYRFYEYGYCGYDAPLESTALTFPQSPTITSTSVSATPTALACDATSYTRTVTVNYTNGKGKKIVIEDETGNKLYTSPTALTSSDGSISPSVMLSAIDGAAHYVIAYFDGYDCKSEPAHKGTYTAPVQPVISDVTVSTVGETKCSPYNYSISGTVTYSNADISKKLIVEYGAGALKDEITLSSASATMDFEISDMTATGSELTVKAYFKDAPAACSKTSNTFASPTQPSMDIKNIKQSTPGCDDLTYNLSFDVDYIYQGGNLTVGVEAYGDTTITIPTSKRNKAVTNTVHVTYTGKIPADGEEHSLSASFAGTNSCSDTKTLDDVLSSVIKTVNVTVPTTPIECDAENYAASVSVETQYAVGKSVTIRYTDANDDVVLLGTKVVPAGGTVSFTGLTFNDIEASGTRYVEAFIVERDTCVKSGDYAVPPTTTIDPFVYGTITDKSTCTGVLYDITGSITYSSKPDGVNPGVRIGGTTVTAEMTDITESGATYTFTDVSVEGDALHLEAYFENKPDCKVPSTTFSSPAQRQLVKIVLDPDPTPACSDDSYTLTGKLQYKNIDDKPQVWRDSESATSIDDGWDANVNEQKEVPFSITMPTDGQKHVIHANVTDWSTTCAIQTDYTAIWRPKVTKVTPSVSAFVHCDEKYDLTLDIDYSRGVIGKMIYASCKEGSTTFDGEAKLTATSGTVQVVIKNLTMRDGTDHALTISFEDVDCEFTGYSYNEPKTKTVTLGAPSIVDVGCGWSTFSIKGTVSANVAGEKIIVTDGYGHSSTELTSSTTGTTYEIGGLTASGTIYAQFIGKDCSKTGTQSFTAPAAKPIPSLTLDEIDNICYGTEKLTVTYTMTGATKYNYTVTRSTTSGSTIVESKTNQTAESIELDNKLWSDGTYILTMTAVSADGCTKDASRSFTIWAQPKITIEQLIDACDDAENTSLKFNTTDALTYNYYIVGATNLLATPVSVTDGEHTVSLDIKSLNVGNVAKEYTLKMVANSTSCHSDTAEAKFTVNPLPELSFSSIADQCNSVSEVEVTYTPTYVKSFTYSVQKGSAPALVSNTVTVPATEPYTFKVNTNGWGEGTYSITADLTSPNNCTAAAAAASFTILPKPKVNSLSMQSRCWHSIDKSELSFSVSNATHYQYRIDDGTYSAKAEIGTSKCEVDVSGLAVGKHSVSIIAYSGDCRSEVLTVNEAFEIYPLPTFIFNTAVAHDCYPSTTISVGYTSTNADKYSYTLTKEGAGSPARTVADQSAAADGTIVLNTTGLAAGIYELEVTAKSNHNCEMTAPVTKTVTIYNQPTVDITSVENHCEGSDDITVGYTAEYATDYTYEVVGTTISGHGTVTEPGSFKINLSSLDDGDYTLRMHVTAAHSPLTCDGTTDEESFTVWAVPEVSFVTPAPIKEGVPNVTVTLELDKAETYDWRFMNGTTTLESGADVSAGTTTITPTTGTLDEGTYSLFVTPKTSHCTGEEKEVHVVVNNKPTINFTEPDIVCAGSSTLNVEYSTSPDAADLYYTIKQGATTVVSEQHVDLTTTASPLPVNISSLTYGTYTLTGYVRSALERGDDSSVDFTLMAVPTENDVKQDLAFIGCEETYDATITVNIGNAAGRKIYAKYTDDGDHTLPVETSAGDPTATFHLTDLTHTDISEKHEVKVYVDGFEDCGIIVGYDEPKLMTITEGFEVKPLPKSCGEEKFSLTGKVVANCNEGKIVVEYNDTYKTEVNASTSGSDFTIADIPAGGSVTKLKAYFQGKTCGVVESAEFVEPTKPETSIVFTPYVTPLCDVTTFNLEFTLDYSYQEEGTLTVWVDNDHKNTYNSADNKYAVLAASTQLNGTIEGLPADGRTGQKLYFEFSGAHSCSGSIDLPVFPQTPLITGVSVTNVPLYIEGLEGTYSPTITVTYQKAVGERIVLEYFNKNDQSQLAYSPTAVSGDGSYEFSGLSFDDVTMGSRTVHAYFEDSDCKTGGNHDGTYTAPTNSSITFESLTLVNTSTCESLRYNLTGKVSFVGAVVSDLVVEFDATHQYVIPQSQCVAGKALEFAINGVSESIPAEGKTLSAYFSLIPGNVAYSEPVYEPLVPSLDAEIVRVDTIFTCGSKSYTVFLNITSENQRGACFVYDSIAGGTLRRVAKHDGTYNGTDEFTIAMPQRVEEHYIIVRYPNTECVVRFAPISVNPYTKPQPEITLTPIERVCNTATELVLPFAITQGDIAEASLTLTDSKEQTIVSDAELTVNATKDTLTYTLPGQLSAGKHTLMVEVRDTLECVATATLPIELALDGQIYSKWNDVLLVDNSQGLYSAYQWYENGQPLSGKTDQVLYLPDGMNGMYTCLLTTAEGQLFTCEYEFEDIPRSADQQFSDNDITVLPNRVKAGGVVAVQQSQSETLRLILMSATGQRIGEYTQTDSKQLICMPAVQGVYLLRITSDSGLQTEKIVVY